MSRRLSDRGDAQEKAPEAERMRRGQFVMRTRAERIVFAIGLGSRR